MKLLAEPAVFECELDGDGAVFRTAIFGLANILIQLFDEVAGVVIWIAGVFWIHGVAVGLVWELTGWIWGGGMRG